MVPEFLFTTYFLRQLSNISPEHLLEGNVGHHPSFPTSIKGQALSLQDKIELSEGKQKISGLQENIFLRECNNFFHSHFLLELTVFVNTWVLGNSSQWDEKTNQRNWSESYYLII